MRRREIDWIRNRGQERVKELETYLKKDKKGRSPYKIKDRETLKAIKNVRKGK